MSDSIRATIEKYSDQTREAGSLKALNIDEDIGIAGSGDGIVSIPNADPNDSYDIVIQAGKAIGIGTEEASPLSIFKKVEKSGCLLIVCNVQERGPAFAILASTSSSKLRKFAEKYKYMMYELSEDEMMDMADEEGGETWYDIPFEEQVERIFKEVC